MTGFALALVLVAAVLHATWNLLAKRAQGGAVFTWLFTVIGTVVYLPLALVVLLLERPHLGWQELLFVAGSGTLHTVYFLLLNKGYRSGDLSLVYPLARGSGPMLASIGAILFLGEQPGPVALGGALLIALGVVFLAANPHQLRPHASRQSIVFALLTGLLIACYTLWDKHAVSALMIPPLLQHWGAGIALAAWLTPAAVRGREELRAAWRDHRGEALGIAVLSPLAYILVLTALVFSPVSYVAPVREISILVGTALGTHLLAEGDAPRRLIGAGAMVCGVVALAIG